MMNSVSSRVVESLADVPAGCDQHTGLPHRDRRQARRQFLAFATFHLAAKDEEVLNLPLERTDQLFEMVVALGEHQRGPSILDVLPNAVVAARTPASCATNALAAATCSDRN